MKAKILLFILLLAECLVFGQNKKTLSLYEQAEALIDQNDVEGAITLYREAINKTYSQGSIYTLNNLNAWIRLAEIYAVKTDMQEVRNCSKEALMIMGKLNLSQENRINKQIYILTFLVSSELAQGNKDGCKEYLDIASQIIDTEKGNDSIRARYSMFFAPLYMAVDEDAIAGEMIKKALAIYVEKGKDCHEYAEALLNYANYLEKNESTYMAIKYCERAVNMYQKVHGEGSYICGIAYNALSDLYASDKRYDEAILYKQKYIDVIKDIGFDQVYIPAKDLIQYEYYANHLNKIKTLLPQVVNYLIADTKKNFLYLNSYERANYVYGICNFLNFTLVKYAVALQDKELWGLVYDVLLFSKGVLLNSEQSIQKIVKNSNNPKWVEMYDSISALRSSLKKAKENDKVKNIKEISVSLRNQESSLLKELAVSKDYTESLSLTWRQVQSALKEGDVAIEFCVSKPRTDLEYGAIIIKKDQSLPQYIPLYTIRDFVSNAVKEEQKISIYKTWDKLSPYLTGVKRVFFSPIGDIHKYPIEYFAPNGMESVLFYRVSSTKEIVSQQTKMDLQEAVVYGGLDYEGDYGSINDANKKNEITFVSPKTNRNRDSDNIKRGAVVTLDGALKEAKNIKKILQEHHISNKLYTGIAGSEESFKFMSGSNLNLIHIATHGFYWEDKELKANQFKSFIRINADEKDYSSTEVMTHSGLLFAGANRSFRNEFVPTNMEDGVLTAEEISLMNLNSVRLVVLSACETGLGEIDGEGVFGLQRGFKSAGVQSILMSLWKVDDEATNILMTQFYQNLLSGNTKGYMSQSLLKAQKYLRQYEHGKYSDPSFWAAFILLDAID